MNPHGQSNDGGGTAAHSDCKLGEKAPTIIYIKSPHEPQNYHKPHSQLLNKNALNGPVTSVAILNIPDSDNDILGNSRFCVLARGPWIELIPLNSRQPKHKIYRHFAFGRGNCESGSIHGIRHTFLRKYRPNIEDQIVWAFFGGRKLSLATSNGLLEDTRKHENKDDPFLPILIDHEEQRSSQIQESSFLTVSDWIWDARIIPIIKKKCVISKHKSCVPFDYNNPLRILVAIGLAHNIVEIWCFHELASTEISTEENTENKQRKYWKVKPTRLRKLICNDRCITYSLSLFGWKEDHNLTSSIEEISGEDLELAVVVGTVSNKILIWNVLDNLNGETLLNDEDLQYRKMMRSQECIAQTEVSPLKIQSKPVCHTLSGHEGVIFSCKFGKGGVYLASTSDDRTIRFWKKTSKQHEDGSIKSPSINSRVETCIQAKAISDNKQSTYNLIWTGYGHISRVWDCDFLSLPILYGATRNESSNELGGIVTAGEDGTIKVWSIDQGIEVANLEGHVCQSVWKVNAAVWNFDEEHRNHTIVSGGNDGTAKLWDLDYHMKNNAVANINGSKSCMETINTRTFLIPEDSITTSNSDDIKRGNALFGCNIDHHDANAEKDKVKKSSKHKRQMGQAVCGMTYYPKSNKENRLLLATRAGMLCTLCLQTGTWQMHAPWAEPILKNITSRVDEVDPINGSCIAIHAQQSIVAVATTRGQIVLTYLQNTSNAKSPIYSGPKLTFSASKYLAIQGLKWLDGRNLLAFHIKGIVVWWTFPKDFLALKFPDSLQPANKPFINRILSMNVKSVSVGVPMSYLFDKSRAIIFIGDSRGNIGFFNIIEEKQNGICEIPEQLPLGILTRVHQKEHVNCIISTSDDKGILSVGNDGRMQECTFCCDNNGKLLKLQKVLSRPISNLSGPNCLWRVKHTDGLFESIIVSGFHGNKFIIYDLTLGYKLLKVDTGGRQRQYDLSVDFTSSFYCPSYHQLAFCVSTKGQPNKIIVHANLNSFNKPPLKDPVNPLKYSVGNPCHGETILDVAFCETSSSGSVLLLCGSNDCTVKLFLVESDCITLIKELPPHESCIRALCSSHHSDSSSSLLVVGGGKMILSFYLVDEIAVKKNQSFMSASNFSVNFLCQSKLSFQSSIDHRVNAVKAIPLLKHGSKLSQSHLVLYGDSNGGLHMTVVNEDHSQQRHVESKTLMQDARPILCIDLLRVDDNCILACVGDTAGDISIWLLPGFIDDGEENFQIKRNGFNANIPTEPVHVYKAHRMGTNCVTMFLMDKSNDVIPRRNINVVVGSGGDDQAISLFLLDATICSPLSGCESTIISHDVALIFQEASSSALKGIHIIGDTLKGHRLYTVGYDQRVAIWNLNLSELKRKSHHSVTFLSSTPVDIFDVNCMDHIFIKSDNGQCREIIVAGGEGLELLSLNLESFRAAKALCRSNYLLINCGAGFSADSGLSTYESMPKNYSHMCNPLRLIDDREEFNSFWRKCAATYSYKEPHSGYTIIESWCYGGILKNLGGAAKGTQMDLHSDAPQMSPWWIYTSNVDGHFYRCKGFDDTMCEIHGRATEFRCANAAGYVEERRRCGKLWDRWNDEVAKRIITHSCRCSTFAIDCSDDKQSSNVNLCDHCSLPIRPNVLMFHDTDGNVLRDIKTQRERYQNWEAKVEEYVANGCHLVILELGAGVNVPAVRIESEEVLSDCRARLSENSTSSGSVTCIRINPKDAGFELDLASDTTISIYERAESALSQIHRWVQLLEHGPK